jgi:hypothetical protein
MSDWKGQKYNSLNVLIKFSNQMWSYVHFEAGKKVKLF